MDMRDLLVVNRKAVSLCNRLHLHLFAKFIAFPRFVYCLKFLQKRIPETLAKDFKSHLQKVEERKKIFVMWLQGYEQMPLPVKKCWESIQRHACTVGEPVLITQKNIKQYLDLPDYILKKVKEGIITRTQFSDIVRSGLLARWGGIWIDSTVFLSSDIPSAYVERDFFCPSGIGDTVCTEWSLLYGKSNGWCVWFVGSMYKHLPVFEFVHNAFLEYYRNETASIDYFMLDLFITLFFRKDAAFRESVCTLPANNCRAYELMALLKKEVSEKNISIWNDIKNSGFINKITYKKNYQRQLKNGKPTMFDYIMYTSRGQND